jgi:hypothetical protein
MKTKRIPQSQIFSALRLRLRLILLAPLPRKLARLLHHGYRAGTQTANKASHLPTTNRIQIINFPRTI